MTDPIQQLIDAGAIPSTPFVVQSRYNGVALGLLQRRAGDPGVVYVRRRFIPALNTMTIAARHVVGPTRSARSNSATRCCTGASPMRTPSSTRTS
jgi:hypothetical protein